MAAFLLIFFGLVLRDGDAEAMSSEAQAWLAVNVFARCMKMIGSLTVMQGVGTHIIAVSHSMFSGAMLPMLLIAASVFGVFDLVFIVLRPFRPDSPGKTSTWPGAAWTTMFLYRDLLFGDGDGLKRFGLDDETGEMEKFDEIDHRFLFTLFGTAASLIFSIVILNLIIAIYSDEYKVQNKLAPAAFVRHRAIVCASRMLKYSWLARYSSLSLLISARLVPVAIAVVAGFINFLVGTNHWLMTASLAAIVGTTQFALLTIVGRIIELPAETLPSEAQEQLNNVRRFMSGVGVHPEPSFRSDDLGVKRSDDLGVKRSAKLLSSHCVEVQIHGQAIEEGVCKRATLSCDTQSGHSKIDVVYTQSRDDKSTFVFEPVMNIWGPLTMEVDGRKFDVHLPRFLWLCCRKDFEQADMNNLELEPEEY